MYYATLPINKPIWIAVIDQIKKAGYVVTSDISGFHRASIQRALKRLHELGILERHENNQGYYYTLIEGSILETTYTKEL